MKLAEPPLEQSAHGGFTHWRRNLFVATFGAFTTTMAMALLLPFLPLYIEQLGVSDPAAIVQWSGVAFGATYKLMLIRASLGMAISMSLIGMVQSVYQLVALRLLAGFLGGYPSGSYVLVATQTPRASSAWTLGMLSSGIMAGNLAGPLLGGILPPMIGIRATFLAAGVVILVAFIAIITLIREETRREGSATAKGEAISDRRAEKTKVHGDMFQAALDKLDGIGPADAIVVIDTPYDVEATRTECSSSAKSCKVEGGGGTAARSGQTYDALRQVADYPRSTVLYAVPSPGGASSLVETVIEKSAVREPSDTSTRNVPPSQSGQLLSFRVSIAKRKASCLV